MEVSGAKAKRVETLFQHIDGVVVIAGNKAVQSVGDGEYPFVQESNLAYLTGIDVPGCYVIFLPTGKQIIVYPDRSAIEVSFEGEHAFPEGFELISASRADELLDELSLEYDTAYIVDVNPDGARVVLNDGPLRVAEKIKETFKATKDITKTIARARALKEPDELKAMRDAIATTVSAFSLAKDRLNTLEYEYELEAEFTYGFRRANAQHAYEPIVASGKNALTLHYNKNNQILPKNGLVLIDIGARVGGYAADITRTYAIGTPTDREVAVHAAVEKAHFAIIDLIKPGVTFETYQNQSDEIMKSALSGLGLLNNPDDYRKYFPHAVSHGIGIDVHESLGGHGEFKAGMVLTVEPGIYIPEEGIGVRIEDDILVTESGNENLSAGLSTAL